MALPTLLYMVSILFPRLLNAEIAAIEIKVATSAYSIALAPFSLRRSFVNPHIPHPLVNRFSGAPPGSETLFLFWALPIPCGFWLTSRPPALQYEARG